MDPAQVTCFACGTDPREYVPLPGRRLSSTVLILLAATWLSVMAAVLLPRISGRPWSVLLAEVTAGRHTPGSTHNGQSELNRIVVTPELRHLIREYEREVDFWLGQVGRLRQRVAGTHGVPDSSIATLDWAGIQLAATRRMIGTLAVCSDSEVIRDVESFLDQRLTKVRARLEYLKP